MNYICKYVCFNENYARYNIGCIIYYIYFLFLFSDSVFRWKVNFVFEISQYRIMWLKFNIWNLKGKLVKREGSGITLKEVTYSIWYAVYAILLRVAVKVVKSSDINEMDFQLCDICTFHIFFLFFYLLCKCLI